MININSREESIFVNRQIGKITKKIIQILNLKYNEEKPIFIGDANIKHIKDEHPEDFKKYASKIEEIIKYPTYLARNEKKKSIEFIKRYNINEKDYVLVDVRVSNNNVHFARTMYIMADEKVQKYFKHKYFYKF